MSHEFNWFDMPDWAKSANQAAERANRMQQEQLAREWADYAKNCEVSSPEEQAAAEFILANTKPPTMEDVEWDVAEHYLAGATIAVSQAECVMLSKRENGMIATAPVDGDHVIFATPGQLTPNGKRYELREVTVSSNESVGPDQQDHPKVLRTVEDYENALNGTVVAIPGFHTVWVKDRGKWSNGTDNTWLSDSMGDEDRQVLRRGWGE